MPAEKEFKSVLKNGNRIIFKKLDFDFKNDSGKPIYGWINKDYVTLWINHLRGLNNSLKLLNIEVRNYNPGNLILYKNNQIIGWINDDKQKEIENFLWNYLKSGQIDEIVEDERESNENESNENEKQQLSLF